MIHTPLLFSAFFFFNDPAPTEIYTLSLHDALPISLRFGSALVQIRSYGEPSLGRCAMVRRNRSRGRSLERSEEHTSELQSRPHLVCRLLLEKKKIKKTLHNKRYKKASIRDYNRLTS